MSAPSPLDDALNDDAVISAADDLLPVVPSRRRSRLVLASLIAALLTLFVVAWRGPAIAAWWRGEIDLRGRRQYRPPHPIDRAALRAIRFDLVHEQLLPRWLLSLVRPRTTANERASETALSRLRAEIRRDRNLDALVTELQSLAREGLATTTRRARYVLWAWSAYLDQARVPYRLEASLRVEQGVARLHLKTYEVLEDVRITVGSERYRARVLRRADRTALREAYLGHTGDGVEGALLVSDRVYEIAVDEVWPLLGPDDTDRSPLDRAHGPAVRAEAERVLPPEHLAVLARTAAERATVLRVIAAIDDRAYCSRAARIGRLPWRGVTGEQASLARANSLRYANRECPLVTPDEADALALASERLGSAQGLDRALGSLVAWVTRAVAVHEARHAADDRQVDGLRTSMRCPACPEWLRTSGRAELSAYLATFATPGVAYLSYYQSCRAAGEGIGPHVDALVAFGERLSSRGCGNPPPSDLASQAQHLERVFFGRSEPVRLPPGFPATRPLPE